MSGYPNPLAGQTPTAALLDAMIPAVEWKTGDTARSAVTTPAADPDLQVPVLAGASYVFDGLVMFNGGSAAATMDLRFGMFAPGTPSIGRWSVVFPSTTATADGDIVRVNATPINTATVYGLLAPSGTGVSMGMQVTGFLTADTAGVLSAQWAQSVSNAGSLTCLAGSWLRAQRVT